MQRRIILSFANGFLESDMLLVDDYPPVYKVAINPSAPFSALHSYREDALLPEVFVCIFKRTDNYRTFTDETIFARIYEFDATVTFRN